jgi:transcriptional regulator with XRE-family HTH domain
MEDDAEDKRLEREEDILAQADAMFAEHLASLTPEERARAEAQLAAWEEARRAREEAWRARAKVFGSYVEGQRHVAGLTQLEVAKAVGMSHSYISKVELGNLPDFRFRFLESLAKALGLSMAQLILEGGLVDLEARDVETLSTQRQLLITDLEPLSDEELADLRLAIRTMWSVFGFDKRYPGVGSPVDLGQAPPKGDQ